MKNKKKVFLGYQEFRLMYLGNKLIFDSRIKRRNIDIKFSPYLSNPYAYIRNISVIDDPLKENLLVYIHYANTMNMYHADVYVYIDAKSQGKSRRNTPFLLERGEKHTVSIRLEINRHFYSLSFEV